MKLIEQCVEHPVKVYVGMILLVLFGLIAMTTMPIQLVPEVQIPTLTITTVWPGATPQEIESEIIEEQEEALQSVEGVTKMTSECNDSQALITLEFPVGTDLDSTLTLVNSRLQQVPTYPENADKPVISTANASDSPIAWFIVTELPPSKEKVAEFVLKHPDLQKEVVDGLHRAMRPTNSGLQLYRIDELAQKFPVVKELMPNRKDVAKYRKFAEDVIEKRLEKVVGISASNVFGGEEQELQVIIDPEKLASRKLTLPQLRNALREKNVDTSGGDISEGKRRYVIRTLGRYRTPDQVSNTLIIRDENRSVYVRDVADVILGYKKPTGVVQRYGKSVIAVNALRRTGSNVLQTMDRLRDATAELNKGRLATEGLYLSQVYDETEYINSSIGLVWENIWQGAVLTVIVLLLFLRNFRSTVIVFISIAVSIIGMFLMMRLMGRTLNVPSLAGIAFAVGMLVDNFIVVLENGFRHRSMGEKPWTAAIRGASEVWGAVLTSTLANLAVFIPIMFVQDEAGQLFRDIALAAAASLVMSLFVALFFVSATTARILGGVKVIETDTPDESVDRTVHEEVPGWKKPFIAVTTFLDQLGGLFVNTVVGIDRVLLQSRIAMLVTSFIFVFVSLGVSWLIFPKMEYLPEGNRNLIIGMMLPPAGYNLKEFESAGHKIEQTLKPYWDYDSEVGPPDEKFPPISDFFYVVMGRQVFLGLVSGDETRAKELIPLVMSSSAQMPGSMVMAFQMSLFSQGLTSGRNIDVEISGPDTNKLIALAGEVLGKTMMNIPEARPYPKPSLDLAKPEINIELIPEKGADNGITSNADLGYSVDALVDGAYTTDFFLNNKKIDLTVLNRIPYDRLKTEDLRQLKIATPNGDLVELQAVADVRMSGGPESILRRERQRNITLQITPPATVPLEEAVEIIQSKAIQPLRDRGAIDDGYYFVNMGGTADKLQSAWLAMRWNLLLALIITYLVMAALFESWLYPFVIMLSVPLGAVGGFLGLFVLNMWGMIAGFHQSLDVLTMLGFVILIGTVVNNPILIVEQALNHLDEGYDYRNAVLESVRTRIRPIFMTTFIGLFGLFPMVISPGSGSELYRGLGAVLLGGLLISTAFTLILVPCLFTLAMQVRELLFGAQISTAVAHSREAGESATIVTVAEAKPVPVHNGHENGHRKSMNGEKNGNEKVIVVENHLDGI